MSTSGNPQPARQLLSPDQLRLGLERIGQRRFLRDERHILEQESSGPHRATAPTHHAGLALRRTGHTDIVCARG